MNKSQSKSPLVAHRQFMKGINEQNKNIVQSPTPINMAESLDLIQYKCYQDILKSKSDQRSTNVPLSYSKSIQYLGRETNSFLKLNDSQQRLQENKSTTAKQQEIILKSSKFVQSQNNFRNNDATMPVLQQQDYWSPVDNRVQRLIQKSVQKQRVQQDYDEGTNHQYSMLKSDSECLNKKDDQKQQSAYDDPIKIEQDAMNTITTNHFENSSRIIMNNCSQTLNSNQAIISSYINKNSQLFTPKNNRKDNILLQEKYALKSSDKIKQIEEQKAKSKQFTPLKLNPPFVKRAYEGKSITYTMGFLKNTLQNNGFGANIIHANDKLRSQWQNRIGNSQSKQSLMNQEMMETNGWKFMKKNNSSRFLSTNQGIDHNIQTDLQYPMNQSQQEVLLDDITSHQTNFDQLMRYTNYTNSVFGENQGGDFNNKNEEPTEKVSSSNECTVQNGSSSKNQSQVVNASRKYNSQSLNSNIRYDKFNHFYKSNTLMQDLEKIKSQKIKTQLSNMQGFKQQVMMSDAEMIIQNQLPGSKIILRQVHTRNLTQSQEAADINHKVYYTLPDRVNFFKSKNFGVSPQQNIHLNLENPPIK